MPPIVSQGLALDKNRQQHCVQQNSYETLLLVYVYVYNMIKF